LSAGIATQVPLSIEWGDHQSILPPKVNSLYAGSAEVADIALAPVMALGLEDSLILPHRHLSALWVCLASLLAKCCDELFIAIDIIGTMGSEYNSFRSIKQLLRN
jgi:hypothetical protein